MTFRTRTWLSFISFVVYALPGYSSGSSIYSPTDTTPALSAPQLATSNTLELQPVITEKPSCSSRRAISAVCAYSSAFPVIQAEPYILPPALHQQGHQSLAQVHPLFRTFAVLPEFRLRTRLPILEIPSNRGLR